MTHDISKFDNIIDSRDVIARIEELEGYRDDSEDEETEDTFTDKDGKAHKETAYWNEDTAEELAILQAFADEGESLSDWHHGVTLIHDDYFEEYAEEFANDIGAIDRKENWPCNHIDWEAAADELKQDYTAIEFDGETFWGRD